MTLDCGKPACPEHGTMCAFHGDEPGRCPWCHSSWVVIRRGGWHSCERSSTWGALERQDRLETARVWRQEASRTPQELDTGPHCPHVVTGANDDGEAVSP